MTLRDLVEAGKIDPDLATKLKYEFKGLVKRWGGYAPHSILHFVNEHIENEPEAVAAVAGQLDLEVEQVEEYYTHLLAGAKPDSVLEAIVALAFIKRDRTWPMNIK